MGRWGIGLGWRLFTYVGMRRWDDETWRRGDVEMVIRWDGETLSRWFWGVSGLSDIGRNRVLGCLGPTRSTRVAPTPSNEQ